MYINAYTWNLAWSSKWQPTPVFLPGKFHVQRNLADYSPWGCKESDMTEYTHTHTDRAQSFGFCGRRQGWDDLSTETCIFSYVKHITSPGSMQDTGCLGLVPWDDSDGGYREGGGRGFRMGNTCTPMAGSCQCMAKSTTIL